MGDDAASTAVIVLNVKRLIQNDSPVDRVGASRTSNSMRFRGRTRLCVIIVMIRWDEHAHRVVL